MNEKAFTIEHRTPDGQRSPGMKSYLQEQLDTLWISKAFTLIPDPMRAGYYSDIDMVAWARKVFSGDFAEYLCRNYKPKDMVIRLANDTSAVVLDADASETSTWNIRVWLANLYESDFRKIGQAIKRILTGYYYAYRADQAIPATLPVRSVH